MISLQRANVAAGVVTIPDQAHRDPHFQARNFFMELDRAAVGKQLYPRSPISFSETQPAWFASPTLGQHNEYVLRDILGYSDSEIKEMEKAQVIGTVPLKWGGTSGT